MALSSNTKTGYPISIHTSVWEVTMSSEPDYDGSIISIHTSVWEVTI